MMEKYCKLPLRGHFLHQELLETYCSSQWLNLRHLRVQNATLYFHLLSWHFFFLFFIKKISFYIFIYFFDEVLNFCNRILTNQKPR